MKKLMLILFLMIFLVGTVSAVFEIDNVGRDYNKTTQTITIKNAFGLGDDIAKIKLDTPLVYNVFDRGHKIKQLVAEFTIDNLEYYDSVINNLDFYNVKNGLTKFNREFEYKYKVYYNVNVSDYEDVCKERIVFNGTEKYDCVKEEIGKHIEQKFNWVLLDSELGLNKGNITIGIFTDVFPNERVEWIPTLFGVRINQWAVWTSDLNDGLVSAHNFSTQIENTRNDASSEFNLFNKTGSPALQTVNCLIESCGNVTDGKFEIDEDNNWRLTQPNLTVSIWVYPHSTTLGAFFSKRSGANGWGMNVHSSGRFVFLNLGSVALFSIDNAPVGSWTHLVYVRNLTSSCIYVNGTLENCASISNPTNNTLNATLGNDPAETENWDGLIDESYLWNKTLSVSQITDLYNNGSGISRTLNIVLNTPIENFNTINQTITFNGTIIPNTGLINVSLILDGINNETNSSGVDDIDYIFIKTLSPGTHNWTYEICTATSCETAITRAFSISDFVENAFTFNASVFETSTESYLVNITTTGAIPTAATFTFDGTEFSGVTVTNTAGNDFDLERSIDVPEGAGDREFNFNFTLGSTITNTTSQTQEVNATNFTLCGAAPQDVSFLNVTFRNETVSEESVNATISSTFIFWLGTGSANKTSTFSNASENAAYEFCGNPPDRSFAVDIDIAYNNAESQQRIFTSSSTLTNVTLNQVLFLLPTSLGIFTTFQTVDTLSNPIALVQGVISRTLGSSIITVTSDFTDSSGIVVYFLNPDITYTGLFTKLGFFDNTFTFVPTTDVRRVIMGITGQAVEGSNISVGTTYSITPTNNSLTNNTNFNFGFNVSSTETITLISMNITNSSGSQLFFDSTAGVGNLSGSVNTGNLSRIVGTYIIETANETLIIPKIWIVGDEFIGDYSLFRQMNLFLGYLFSDFMRLLIVILTITGIIIFMSIGEITDTSESKIAAITLLVWMFSVVGWLNNPSVVSDTGIAQFSRQYGIAILTTFGASFFIFRRVFIRRI